MGLIPTDDQLILRDMAKGVPALRDAGDATGFSRELWQEMAELGWVGIPFPEAVGGADMGYGELGIVLGEGGAATTGTASTNEVQLNVIAKRVLEIPE